MGLEFISWPIGLDDTATVMTGFQSTRNIRPSVTFMQGLIISIRLLHLVTVQSLRFS